MGLSISKKTATHAKRSLFSTELEKMFTSPGGRNGSRETINVFVGHQKSDDTCVETMMPNLTTGRSIGTSVSQVCSVWSRSHKRDLLSDNAAEGHTVPELNVHVHTRLVTVLQTHCCARWLCRVERKCLISALLGSARFRRWTVGAWFQTNWLNVWIIRTVSGRLGHDEARSIWIVHNSLLAPFCAWSRRRRNAKTSWLEGNVLHAISPQTATNIQPRYCRFRGKTGVIEYTAGAYTRRAVEASREAVSDTLTYRI